MASRFVLSLHAVAVWTALAGGSLLAGCGGVTSVQSRYTGTLAGCGPSTQATLTRLGSDIAFAPADGVLILRGTVAADGSFSAQMNTQPPGKPPYLLTARGHLEDESATLEYATPRCRAAVTLARVHAALL